MLKKNLSIGFIAQIFNSSTALITSIILANLLGPEMRGEYSIFLGALSIFSVWLSFSMTSGIIYYVGSDSFTSSSVLWTSSLFSLLSSTIVYMTVDYFNSKGFGWIFISNNQYPKHTTSMMFSFTFLIMQLNANINAILTAKKLYYAHSLASMVINFIVAFFWIACFCGFFTISEIELKFLICIFILTNLASLILSNIILNNNQAGKLGFNLLRKNDFYKLIKFSATAYLCNAIQILTYKLDFWVVDYYHGAAQTGIYTLAVNLGQLLWIFPNTIASVLLGHLAGIKEEDSIYLVKKYCRYGIATTSLLLIASIPLIHCTLEMLYGLEFAPAKNALYLLLPGITIFSTTTIIASYYGATGRLFINMQTSITGFIVALISYATFIPNYGINGAAVSSTIAYFISTAYIVRIFLIHTKSKLVDILPSNKDFAQIIMFRWK